MVLSAMTSKGSLLATVVLLFFMVVALLFVPPLFSDFSFRAYESERNYSQSFSTNWSDYGTLDGLKVENSDLILKDSVKDGSYESDIFDSGKYIIETVSYDIRGINKTANRTIVLTVNELDRSYNVIESKTISLDNGSYQEIVGCNSSGFYEFILDYSDPDKITDAPSLSYIEFEGSVRPVTDVTRLKYVIFILVALVTIYVAATGAG